MVVAADPLAAEAGVEALRAGGTAVDAAVTAAFVLAVTYPTAGNIGGGGFLVHRAADGSAAAYDFRETAPAAASPEMFMPGGVYDAGRHHDSHAAVGVPGSVAGLHRAWMDHGRLPWRRLWSRPSPWRATVSSCPTTGPRRWRPSCRGWRAIRRRWPPSRTAARRTRRASACASRTWRLRWSGLRSRDRPASTPDAPPSCWRARWRRTADSSRLADLAAYAPWVREPIRGAYRGHTVLSMPPPSSGGVALVQMLNVLEGWDLRAAGHGSAANVHRIAETMRRAFADRARFLGDPDFNRSMPVDRLTSKPYAARLRVTIGPQRASVSGPDTFEWPPVGQETTHLSVVDAERNAVALTTTLEQSYGSKIVVPGAGFLLNNEMGDFNAGPGLTTAAGLIGTRPNLAEPGKRMLSSMTPAIVVRDGRLVLVTGSPGGRTIINTVLHTILNVVDFGMNVQEAVDAPRFHHQWLPDELRYERRGLSRDTIALLEERGHTLVARERQGAVQAIAVDAETGILEGGADPRREGSTAAGY